jgi:hypothetical protein
MRISYCSSSVGSSYIDKLTVCVGSINDTVEHSLNIPARYVAFRVTSISIRLLYKTHTKRKERVIKLYKQRKIL